MPRSDLRARRASTTIRIVGVVKNCPTPSGVLMNSSGARGRSQGRRSMVEVLRSMDGVQLLGSPLDDWAVQMRMYGVEGLLLVGSHDEGPCEILRQRFSQKRKYLFGNYAFLYLGEDGFADQVQALDSEGAAAYISGFLRACADRAELGAPQHLNATELAISVPIVSGDDAIETPTAEDIARTLALWAPHVWVQSKGRSVRVALDGQTVELLVESDGLRVKHGGFTYQVQALVNIQTCVSLLLGLLDGSLPTTGPG